jgi:hypothetical protein
VALALTLAERQDVAVWSNGKDLSVSSLCYKTAILSTSRRAWRWSRRPLSGGISTLV